MVALDIRCVFLLAVANLILVEISGSGDRNDDAALSQEEEALRQALALVHMLRSDYLKVIKEKQVLSDMLGLLMKQMTKSQPSPTTDARQETLRASANETTSANTENWLNSSTTEVAPSAASSVSPFTSTIELDIPQRRFLQDESKTNLSTTKTKPTKTPRTDGMTQEVAKKGTARKPAPVPSKAKENIVRGPVKQDRPTKHQVPTKSVQKPLARSTVRHSIVKEPAKHVARISKHKGDFWRHFSTISTAPTVKSRDPVLGQIARELINEFHQGNTQTLKQLKHKILISRAFNSRRDGGEDNAANAENNPEDNGAGAVTEAQGTSPDGNVETSPDENLETSPDGNYETNADGNHEIVIGGETVTSTHSVDVPDTATSKNKEKANGVSLDAQNSTINLYDLWLTTHPKPTYRSSLKLYLGRSSRLPTPLPKNNAYCFWEPKSPLCGLAI